MESDWPSPIEPWADLSEEHRVSVCRLEVTWSCSDANTSVVGEGMGAGVELEWGILESSSSGVGVFNSLVEEEPGDHSH